MKKIGILDPQGIYNNPLNGEKYSDKYKELAQIWSHYPAYEKREYIIENIINNQIVFIISSTGTGKTVLIVKYAIHSTDYKGRIAITLPKQIIAKSAAEFAALTMDVELGTYIGYKYKGSDKKYSNPTNLLYATDGTIVSKLLKDPLLSDFDMVIIDEAHERKVQIDFLFYLLKYTLKQRPEFKLIIMSATINEKLFENYFQEFKYKTITLSGKPGYEIKDFYLDEPINDKQYIDEGLKIINEIREKDANGKIIFFVTSISETLKTCDKYDIKDKCVEVYSGMNENLLNDKENKLYVATNVAESSLTIDGIKYVIDSGYEISGYYNPDTHAKVIEKRIISKAQATQRRGRTGRTMAGSAYHLYTKNQFNNMIPYPEPTIRTSNIYEECLKLLALPTIQNIKTLLNIFSEFIEPPTEKYINSALTELLSVQLINKDEITPLGKLIAEINIEPLWGVCAVYGYRLNCLREIISIYSLIEACKGNIYELFYVTPKMKKNYDLMNKFKKLKKNLSHKYGDHLTLLYIFSQYRDMIKEPDESDQLKKWCDKYFIKKATLDKAKNYYNKNKDSVINKLKNVSFSKSDDAIFDEIIQLDLEDKIMIIIMYGFNINIRKNNVMISRDSFLSLDKNSDSKNIVFDTMITMMGKTECNIVSIVPTHLKKYINKLPIILE